MLDRIRIRSGGSESIFSAPDPIVLGRDSNTATVALEHGAVSRRHAQLAHDGHGWVLTDLGSSNGTWVNGDRIDEPLRVSSPTTIRLGKQDEGADITVEPVTETLAPQAAPNEAPETPRLDETMLFGTGALAAGTALRAKLGGKTVIWPAVPGKKYTVGRDPSSDLIATAEIVSRNHLELAWDGEQWTATDISARGTFRVHPHRGEGKQLPEGVPTPLGVSTTLRLGGSASGQPLKLSVSAPRFRRIRKNRRRD